MEYTETVIKEAEEVVSKIELIYYGEDLTKRYKLFYQLAIQDRQSVLDLAKVAVQTSSDEHDDFWQNEIHSLTQQINYLKSKI